MLILLSPINNPQFRLKSAGERVHFSGLNGEINGMWEEKYASSLKPTHLGLLDYMTFIHNPHKNLSNSSPKTEKVIINSLSCCFKYFMRLDLSVMTYFWLIHPNFDKFRDIMH